MLLDMSSNRGSLLLALALLATVAAACAPDSCPASTTLPGPSLALPSASGYPSAAARPVTVGADTVQVLPRGRVAFPVIRALLAAARRSVDLEMYELARPDLVAALIDARRRGLRVTVIDDPSVEVTAATALELRAAGVDVVDYPVRAQMIDHVKLLVLDEGAVAVVGGINWNTTSAAHHDFDAAIWGPAAVNLGRIVRRDLVTCGRRLQVPDALPDPAVLVASTLPGVEIRPLVLQLVGRARTTLDVELYVLTDTAVIHAVERAARRGVRVRIVLEPTQHPSAAAVAELRRAGIPVRWYHGRGELLHAKMAVADGRDVVFGSANWSRNGFERNHEVDVEIRDAPGVAATFLAAAQADWNSALVPEEVR